MNRLPKRYYGQEALDRFEVMMIRYCLLLLCSVVASVAYLPRGSDILIPIIIFAPFFGVILWGLIWPAKSDYERKWTKELKAREEFWRN